MTNEEKKLLTVIIVGISSIDDHLKDVEFLKNTLRTKRKEEL